MLINSQLSIAFARLGALTAVAAAASAILIAIAILWILDALELLVESHQEAFWLMPLISIVLFFWAWYLGGLLGRKVTIGCNPYLFGIFLALGVLAASFLTITVPLALTDTLFGAFGPAHAFESYVLAPFFWIFLVGTLPAIFLGLCWGHCMWCRARKINSSSKDNTDD
jgi:hypothetical protein